MSKCAIKFLFFVSALMFAEASNASTLTEASVSKIAPDSNFALSASRKVACVITDQGRSISLVMRKSDDRIRANTPKKIIGNWMLTYGFAGNENTYAKIEAAGTDERNHDLFNIYNKSGNLVQIMGVYVGNKGRIHLRWYDPRLDKKPYSSEF